MKTMEKYPLTVLLLVLACAAGCHPLAPIPDRTQYFILAPAGGATAGVSSASTAQLALGVGPIKFPEYLKRPGVVTRTSSDRLAVSDDRRWGEPLDQNFESVLCQNLSRMLGTNKIITYPWYADTHIDYQVEVWVTHFEAVENGQSEMAAVWTIKDGNNGRVLASSETTTSAPVQGDDTAGSAALSHDLGEMSRQIADRIMQLNAVPRARALPDTSHSKAS